MKNPDRLNLIRQVVNRSRFYRLAEGFEKQGSRDPFTEARKVLKDHRRALRVS